MIRNIGVQKTRSTQGSYILVFRPRTKGDSRSHGLQDPFVYVVFRAPIAKACFEVLSFRPSFWGAGTAKKLFQGKGLGTPKNVVGVLQEYTYLCHCIPVILRVP